MAFGFDNLNMFLAAVDHGSFSAAGRVLRRVPSAVSMAIANLEAELGLQLFDRTTRDPKPTAAGLALVPQARLLLAGLEQLNVHAAGLTQGVETSLSIAVVPELLATAPWADALRCLADEFPLLTIEVLTAPQADALALLRADRVQLAIVFERYDMTTDEQFLEVMQETLVAVVAPGHPMLAGAANGSLRDDDLFKTRQIVVAGRGAGQVDKRIAISALQWKTDNPVAALHMTTAGLGWAWLPSGFVRDAIAQGKLVQIPTENFTNILRFFVDVVWSAERPVGVAARRFIDLFSGKAGLP